MCVYTISMAMLQVYTMSLERHVSPTSTRPIWKKGRKTTQGWCPDGSSQNLRGQQRIPQKLLHPSLYFDTCDQEWTLRGADLSMETPDSIGVQYRHT